MNEDIKKILVTGGAGFIGSNLVDRLIKEGHTVVIVDDFSTGKKENINANAKVYELSLEDEDLKKVFRRENIDIVYHLASPSNIRQVIDEQMYDLSRYVSGLANLLKNVSEFNVGKIIMSSTMQVYGEDTGVAVTEFNSVNPNTFNGLIHSIQESLLKVSAGYYGFKYTILRYSNVYGMRQTDLGEGGLILKYINTLSNGSIPVVTGDKDALRDYIFVSDVVNANVRALMLGDNEVYNIASGNGKSLDKIVTTIIKKMDKDVSYMSDPGKFTECYYSHVNISKAMKELSWRPTCSIELGLDITCKKNK